ncbi:hypothetical protein M8818_000659 [Zalaria obscura]|uniref:Uncharacterized protein n=1 Tax=Zalaria obscura TaxID=2024903 RepID=A0ACC3SPR7_9PEZI
MDSNPNEVVTILLVNSDDASASELQAQYATAGIEQYAYTPESTTSAPSEWPTLQTLINNGTRLLNFVASLDASSNTVAPYLMDEFTFIFENNYDNSSPSNFSCTANRPASVNGDTESALEQNLMPLMNHFLYSTQILGIETPDTDALNTTNAPSGGEGNLGDTAANCTTAYGRPPTYILVDFFNVGPAITTVDNLNNVTNPTGRTNVSTAILSLQSTSGAQGRRSSLAALLVTLLLGVVLI